MSHWIETKNLILRGMEKKDAEGPYLQWMNDPEVTQYLESRFFPHTSESLLQFIEGMRDGKNLMLAICLKDGKQTHIGNIKLGPIDWIHRRADIGLILGEKTQWGKGYATESIQAISEHAFRVLNLFKVCAGCYHTNVGSQKAFEKAGFQIEATLKRHFYTNGEWSDHVLMAKFREGIA